MASPDLTSAEQAGGEAPQQVTYETLDEGRIAAVGTHTHLLATVPGYRSLLAHSAELETQR